MTMPKDESQSTMPDSNKKAADVLWEDIDDYTDTVFGIIGFLNFYRFDDQTKKMRTDVVVFQGRKLLTSKQEEGEIRYVTPDLGVLAPDDSSVLGEVKKSFPLNQSLWMDDFKQLLSYDDHLKGWPNAPETVARHDIVLIVHQSRAVDVKDYYEARKDTEIRFTRPFVIVEFNRSNERRANYFFRTVLGSLAADRVSAHIRSGVQVPMDKLLSEYSKVKLYDGKPPLPYLMHLIWSDIINTKAAESPQFSSLKKNQKMEVNTTVDALVDELHEGYSFRLLGSGDSKYEQRIPQKSWVQEACAKFVAIGDAEWANKAAGEIRFLFRKHDDVLGRLVEKCESSVQEQKQLKLFDQ